jgi:hypothetical protein
MRGVLTQVQQTDLRLLLEKRYHIYCALQIEPS